MKIFFFFCGLLCINHHKKIYMEIKSFCCKVFSAISLSSKSISHGGVVVQFSQLFLTVESALSISHSILSAIRHTDNKPAKIFLRVKKHTKFCVKRVKWKEKKTKKSDQDGTNPINLPDLACMKKAALKARKKSVRERVSVNSINLYAIYWGKVDYAAISHISPKITIFNSTISLTLHTHIIAVISYIFYFTFFSFLRNFLLLLWLTIKKNKREKRDANSKGISR